MELIACDFATLNQGRRHGCRSRCYYSKEEEVFPSFHQLLFCRNRGKHTRMVILNDTCIFLPRKSHYYLHRHGVYGSFTRQRVFLIIILIYNRWNGEGMRKCSALLEVFSFVRYHVLMHVLLPWNDGNCLLMEKNEIWCNALREMRKEK